MVKVEFEYRDKCSYPKWNKQTCIMDSVEQCKKVYGLGVDCEYHIIAVEEIEEDYV